MKADLRSTSNYEIVSTRTALKLKQILEEAAAVSGIWITMSVYLLNYIEFSQGQVQT